MISSDYYSFFVDTYSLYKDVLASAAQHNESVVYLHISALPWMSFPFRNYRVLSSLRYTVGSHQVAILYIVLCQS